MYPDREIIRRKALLAASSVLLAMTACEITPAKTDDTSDPTDTSTTDDSGADSGADSGDDSGADSGHDTASDRPDCTTATGDDLNACCLALSTWCNDAFGAGTTEANECIYGEDYSGSTGCIPWGPPVPPAARPVVV